MQAATAEMPPELVEGLGLAKTCAKLGISFWDYLGARLGVPQTSAIPNLAELVANPA